MFEIVKVSLENAMDLVLAHKKASRLGERLKLTLSTQTTFSTAVSEVCREVIDRTDSGVLILGLSKEDIRYSLTAKIRYDHSVTIIPSDPGLQNAKRLLPEVNQFQENHCDVIELKIGLPRSIIINPEKLTRLAELFETEAPYTAYEALKKKNMQLHERAAEREEVLEQFKQDNEQKNEFISLASHELKTPVTIIKAYAQMALQEAKSLSNPKILNFITRIEAQSVKLTSLIQQLLDVSKIESGKLDYRMEQVDLNSYLSDTIGVVRHIIPEHQLEVSLGESSQVRLDKLRIEQVLSNIIGNAAKYSPSDSKIKLNSTTEKSHIIVSIKDQGIGMAKEDILKIFEKFHRNEGVVNKFSGLGMGLYISSRIIKEHGGDIWVESKEGEGSVFHFSLPV
ncbi:sensor histidine kinase [Desertivirga brevis]|uniref:sensor histidine kinase n=1 Tax=Desertivirga brevis TaxID=2810310 RepID=UPI001A97169E|nr:HAMP domain-containing sensor histidine kinase [Pedobacter sp. SYSU D00873]